MTGCEVHECRDRARQVMRVWPFELAPAGGVDMKVCGLHARPEYWRGRCHAYQWLGYFHGGAQ